MIVNCVVERRLVIRHPAKGEKSVLLQIGMPFSELAGERWACPVWLNNLEPRPVEIRGIDSLQSFTLALEFAKRTLKSYEERGWEIFWPGEAKLMWNTF